MHFYVYKYTSQILRGFNKSHGNMICSIWFTYVYT